MCVSGIICSLGLVKISLYTKWNTLFSLAIMIIYAPRLVKILTNNFAAAITLFPFILVSEEGYKENIVLINHERIHLRQQLELLIIPFYFWYAVEYLVNRIKGMNHYMAYLHISFEQEAYLKETNPHYLKYRRFAAFLKYL